MTGTKVNLDMYQEATLSTTSAPLGEYLTCSSHAIEEALASQTFSENKEQHKRLGDVLLDSKLISEEKLDEAVRNQRSDRLKACSLFSSLIDSEIDKLSYKFDEISLNAGEMLIEQDTKDNYLYVLASGRMQVYRVNDSGEEVHIATVEPGEPIGEMAYFSGGTRSASVRAAEHSELIRIHHSQLSHCIDLIPGFARSYLSLLTKRLRNTNMIYEDDAHRRRAAERSLKSLNEFLDMSQGLELQMGIEGLIKRVVETASKLMDADRASLFLIDPNTQELWSKVAEGDDIKEIRIPAGAGLAGWVATHKEVLNIEDAYDDERFNKEIDFRTGYRTKTILCGPVWNLDKEIIGVIQVINKSGGSFTPQDESLFRAFAHQAAVAVENFNLYRKVMAGHETMAILLDIATSITQTLDLNSLISKIVSKISDVLHCDRSSFFVLDDDTNELWSMEADGTELQEIRFPATTGLAGHCVSNRQILNIDDAHEDPRFNSGVDKQTGYRTKSVLCIPVINRDGKTTGVVQAINKLDAEKFSDNDAGLLKAISSQISVALENAQLYSRTMNMKNYLESVQASISNSILTVDNDYKVITTNRAMTSLLEKPDEDIVKHDVRDVLGDDNENFISMLQNVYQSDKSLIELDQELHKPSGHSNSVNVNVLPLIDSEEGKQGLVVVLEDITQEKRVKGALSRYMSNDIVEKMLDDPNQQTLGGVRSKATVLFSDIRKFTTISESLSAEATMDFLNEYFTLMVDEVFDHKGVLDKFIGDALMAVFGVPYGQDDDEIRAVRSALGMKKRLAEYNALRERRGLMPIEIGIGINTGEVISGNMGSEKRMDYTVIGDGVNLSSRLEGLNKQYGTSLLISETTREHLGDLFTLREIDKVQVMGKLEPVRIYEVLGEANEISLTEDQNRFVQALELYQNGQFEEAQKVFAEGAATDETCEIFVKRCEKMKNSILITDNWDGVWTATSK